MVKSRRTALDHLFRALADPTRRKMLEKLVSGDFSVSELARPHRMTLPAISKHLKVLERAGLIKRYHDGRTQHIQLRTPPVRKAVQWLGGLEGARASQLEKLEALLSEPTRGRQRRDPSST